MRRPGTGFVSLSVPSRLFSYFFVSALQGNTVMRSPDTRKFLDGRLRRGCEPGYREFSPDDPARQ